MFFTLAPCFTHYQLHSFLPQIYDRLRSLSAQPIYHSTNGRTECLYVWIASVGNDIEMLKQRSIEHCAIQRHESWHKFWFVPFSWGAFRLHRTVEVRMGANLLAGGWCECGTHCGYIVKCREMAKEVAGRCMDALGLWGRYRSRIPSTLQSIAVEIDHLHTKGITDWWDGSEWVRSWKTLLKGN